MANIPLQSITFPDLLNIYNVPTMEGIGKSIFPELIAGGLVDLDSYVEDSDPYLFAAMPQGAGKVLADELVGAKVAWNQMVQNGNFSNGTAGWTPTNGSHSVSGGEYTYTVSTVGTAPYGNAVSQVLPTKIPANHLILASLDIYPAHSKNLFIYLLNYAGNPSDLKSVEGGKWNRVTMLINSGSAQTDQLQIGMNTTAANGYSVGDSDKLKNVMCIDLTAMLETEIANYIRSLEQATAGAGVAFFTKYFGNSYRPYDAGSLQGALVSGHKTVGVNQWDEEWELATLDWSTYKFTPNPSGGRLASKNFIPVIPNTQYYITLTTQNFLIGYEDKNSNGVNLEVGSGKFTPPSNIHYMKFGVQTSSYGTTYKNDICINISNEDINGKYFPYEEHTYDIGPEDLNGIFKLVDGELKADGDVRHADGTVDRRYGYIADLGSLNWSSTQTATDADGNTVYYSSANAVGYNFAQVGATLKDATSTVGKQLESSPISMLHVTETSYTIGNSYPNTDLWLLFRDGAKTAEQVASAVSGKGLVCKLNTPTTDTAEPFEEYQRCNPYGTQEYLLDDSQTVPIPAGHNTKYFEDPLANIMARLDALENA